MKRPRKENTDQNIGEIVFENDSDFKGVDCKGIVIIGEFKGRKA